MVHVEGKGALPTRHGEKLAHQQSKNIRELHLSPPPRNRRHHVARYRSGAGRVRAPRVCFAGLRSYRPSSGGEPDRASGGNGDGAGRQRRGDRHGCRNSAAVCRPASRRRRRGQRNARSLGAGGGGDLGGSARALRAVSRGRGRRAHCARRGQFAGFRGRPPSVAPERRWSQAPTARGRGRTQRHRGSRPHRPMTRGRGGSHLAGRAGHGADIRGRPPFVPAERRQWRRPSREWSSERHGCRAKALSSARATRRVARAGGALKVADRAGSRGLGRLAPGSRGDERRRREEALICDGERPAGWGAATRSRERLRGGYGITCAMCLGQRRYDTTTS